MGRGDSAKVYKFMRKRAERSRMLGENELRLRFGAIVRGSGVSEIEVALALMTKYKLTAETGLRLKPLTFEVGSSFHDEDF